MPSSIRGLTALKALFLASNRLTELPDWLGKLSTLDTLSLSDNKLTTLPESLLNLVHINRLDLDGNPWVSPPPEVVAGGVGSILSYLRAGREGGMQRQWRSKLLLVGQGRAGKSTLVAVLDGRGFRQEQPSTTGMALTELAVERRSVPGDQLTLSELALPAPPTANSLPPPGQQMQLSVWDFGGQEIYHATHQFFLTDRSLFLVVWDTNQGYENSRLPYWLETVTARAPGAPILLVATHGAQRPADLPLDELRARFPAIAGAITVDSATGSNIEKLRDLIAHHAAQLPLMGAPWPQTWAAGVDALRALPAAHTTLAATRALLAGNKIAEPDQDRLLAALTVLGDVLHYPDDPHLAETVVLQPEWLNTRIARILDSHAVHDRGGQLRWSDIDAEWADVEAGMREHFLTMMDRYDISYRVHERDSTTASIVTALLPWQRPDLSAHWTDAYTGRQITVSYHLSFIPAGIPTWFITRTRRFALHHWRTGALLRDPETDTLALVEAARDGDTLRVTARGERLERFLPLLLAELAHSLGRYPGLVAQRHIGCPLPDSPDHSPHGYHHLHLLKRLLRDGTTISCPETDVDVDITPLLAGITPDPAELAALARTVPPDDVETKLGLRLDSIERFTREIRRDTTKLVTIEHEAVGVRCPSVFTLAKIRSGPTHTRYQLRLCCQQPGDWHPVSGEDAAYDVRTLRPWARKIAPTAQTIAATAKAAAPLISLLLAGIALDLNGTAKQDLLDARTHLGAIPSHLPQLDQYPGADALNEVTEPTSFARTDADYRQLNSLLDALDAARATRPRWGGLSAALDSDGHAIYLCARHAHYR